VAGGAALAVLLLAAYLARRGASPPAATERQSDVPGAQEGAAVDRPAPPRGTPARPQRPRSDAQQQRRPITDFDRDGDGQISKAEAPPQMQRNFSRHDTNGDGFIDADEQLTLPGR
jgi:hypothetical protein